MNEEDHNRRKDDGMGLTEKHIQTGAAVILIAMVTWVGVSVTNNATMLATLAERSQQQGEQIKEIKADLATATNGRYTQADALRDNSQQDGRIGRLEDRMVNIETDHRKIVK